MPGRVKAGSRSRRGVGAGLLVAVMVMVPAAIAWACNPQAHLSLDRTSYSPGQSITVYGSYFPGNADITVSGPTGSRSVKTSGGGAFSTTFTAPSRAGSYVISATRPTGGRASVAFGAAARQASAPAPVTESPGSAAPRAPSFDSASVVRSERERSGAGSGGNDGGPGVQTSPGNTGSGSGGGVISQAGASVFAGSVPAGTPGTFAAAPTTAATTGEAARQSSRGASPSEQTAAGYAWSGFAPGETPSLASADEMASEGDTGSGLGLGIGLLAFGLLALAAGLTAAEVSRRRAAA